MITLRHLPSFAIALAVSVLIHLALLFAPLTELAPAEVPLPPLQAKLEPLPLPVVTHRHVAHKTKPPASLPAQAPVVATATSEEPASTEAVVETPPANEPATDTTPAPVTEIIAPAHPLPKQAQLRFAIYKGKDFRVGEARLRFELDEHQHYRINVSANTTGIVSLFKKFDLLQTSSGTLGTQGLHSEVFNETRTSSGTPENYSATFNWFAQTLSFADHSSVALPDDSQDIISFMFQFSQIAWNDPLVMHISNGRKLERYEIHIGAEETIDTNMGKLRAIPFRQHHADNEDGLDIWLAVEYRLLPIKIRKTDRQGNIDSEMVISEIRVADE